MCAEEVRSAKQGNHLKYAHSRQNQLLKHYSHKNSTGFIFNKETNEQYPSYPTISEITLKLIPMIFFNSFWMNREASCVQLLKLVFPSTPLQFSLN